MINYLAALSLGISSKLADLCGEHGWKPFPHAGFVFGFITGALMTYLLFTSGALVATLMVSIIAGLILSGKIDTAYHRLGIGIVIVALMATRTLVLDYPLFIIFTAVCIADEKMHDLVPKLAKKHNTVSKLLTFRPLLELAAFTTSLLKADLSPWLMLACYDIGYGLASQVGKK